VTKHCENARRITQQARLKMRTSPSASAAAVNPSPQHAQKASGRNQEGAPNLTQILSDWVRVAPDREQRQRQEAANRINEFLSTPDATDLNLSDLNLSSLPSVFQLRKEFSTRLEELFLNGNELVALPAEIGQLRALQRLYIVDNQLVALPAEIGRLQALQCFYIAGNQLRALPAEIGQLRALQELNVSDNQLGAIPAEIGRLQALQDFGLSGNTALQSLPSELLHLPPPMYRRPRKHGFVFSCSRPSRRDCPRANLYRTYDSFLYARGQRSI
jgi:Leucine-rich repeat (LRR) protein